jgi:DnaJ-class molecular chaperone
MSRCKTCDGVGAHTASTARKEGCDDCSGTGVKHEHKFGPFEESRFAGTLHRKCVVPGCKVISLDGDEEESK